MTLSDLITKLEEAEGPSRELDAALWGLIDPRPLEEAGEGPAIYKRDPVDTIAFDAPPRFTASVDAALQLTGEKLPGWSWLLRRSGFGDPADAELWNPRRAPGVANSYRASHQRGDPALALCLAMCRAFQSQEPRHDG